ncbi:hypothetical protein [Legionella sp.]|uniref:hypothetical protein n=1 Tax=Legionella sp. TaxID=459 RepID=UPI000CBA3297|nr:hypothetical protein [Legionella sp.]PJE18199.1 MAG: hypothetical protein CK430_00515 [Legionella sp.]
MSLTKALSDIIKNLPLYEQDNFSKLDPTLKALITSERPDLYLANIGLTQEEYKKTTTIPESIKTYLAEQIIKKANGDNEMILKIIQSIMKLEFEVETQNPIRSGNRFVGILMRTYVANQEWIPMEGEEFSFEKAQANNLIRERYEESSIPDLKDYVTVLNDNVKKMWLLMQQAGKQCPGFSSKGLISAPVFQCTQLLPQLSAEEIKRGEKAITLETPPQEEGESFFEALVKDVEMPEFSDNPPIETHLKNIKDHIRNTPWKVGIFFILFKGGVDNDSQRVPHRIDKILKEIKAFDDGEVDAKTAYDKIVKFAQEAIEHPGKGQTQGTKEFYLDIVNHRVLGDYPFAEQQQPSQDDTAKLI